MMIDKDKLAITLSNSILTQKELAKKAGLSTTIISGMLNGHNVSVRPNTVGKLANAFGCKVEDLIQNKEDFANEN